MAGLAADCGVVRPSLLADWAVVAGSCGVGTVVPLQQFSGWTIHD
jgi:hypothetical protein